MATLAQSASVPKFVLALRAGKCDSLGHVSTYSHDGVERDALVF
jgi:hypothetical protein